MSFLGSAITAGASLVNTGLSAWQANHAAHQNQRYAVSQMKWQEKMSNTAHQREIEDLRAAGLNPILTATGGSGATTPQGQSGSIAQGDVSDFDTHSAAEMYKYLDSQKDNIDADTDLKNEQRLTEKKIQAKVDQERLESSSRTGLNNNQYNYQLQTMPSMAETLNSSNAVQRLENEVMREKYGNEKEFYGSSLGSGVQNAGLVLSHLSPVLNSATMMSRAPANVQNLRSYNPSYHYNR